MPDPAASGAVPRSSIDPKRIPTLLSETANFVTWKLMGRKKHAPSKRPFDPKIPFNPGVSNAASDNPATWGTCEEAIRAFEADGRLSGIGYQLGVVPYRLVALDFDVAPGYTGGRDENGIPHPISAVLYALGSYLEYSPSGRGYRVFVLAQLLRGFRRVNKRFAPGISLEIYDQRQFVTLTTNLVLDSRTGEPLYTEIVEAQRVMNDVLEDFMELLVPLKKPTDTHGHVLPVSSKTTQDLMNLACCSDPAFQRLYRSGTHDRLTNPSELDMALTTKLAFWLPEHDIDAVFQSSALMRAKWTRPDGAHGTYGQRTIERALALQTERYSGHPQQHVDFQHVKASYALHRGQLLAQVSSIRGRNRAALRALYEALLGLIADGQFSVEDGSIWLHAGGLDGLKVLVAGERTTLRERLEYFAKLGLLGSVRPGMWRGNPVAILLPLCPADLPAIREGVPIGASMPPTRSALRTAARRERTQDSRPSAPPATPSLPTLTRARSVAEAVFAAETTRVRDLADLTGEGLHTVRRCIRVLEAGGYLTKVPCCTVQALPGAQARYEADLAAEQERRRRPAALQASTRRIRYYASHLRSQPESPKWHHRLKTARATLEQLQSGEGDQEGTAG
ncbi:hypothetical protein MF271_16525 [Deinococcus sp. KNUC1210]|uniref:phage NrS-1 polymerase family protein n=1 Tax=Deinococcus sp. KNUC1210 TaxID=2917691 RepID=UPI001EF1593B|nr:hypothetical protein [Deinococcus sp. KNUC1210]ULH15496.1 hypothetical protein MF271_16525 [Deinococcus sp. KNUC1210]